MDGAVLEGREGGSLAGDFYLCLVIRCVEGA